MKNDKINKSTLTDGLETSMTTEFEENGVNLSGGENQKQQSIARLFLFLIDCRRHAKQTVLLCLRKGALSNRELTKNCLI